MLKRTLLIVAVTSLCLIGQLAVGAKIGTQATKLRFKDIRALSRSLSDLGEAKGYALVFMNTSCPIAQRYMPRLEELHKKYADQGIQFVAVYNSQDETPQGNRRPRAGRRRLVPAWSGTKSRSAPRPWASSACRRSCCSTADSTSSIRAASTISTAPAACSPASARDDLAAAIDELLAGKPISVPETTVDGCRVTALDRTQLRLQGHVPRAHRIDPARPLPEMPPRRHRRTLRPGDLRRRQGPGRNAGRSRARRADAPLVRQSRSLAISPTIPRSRRKSATWSRPGSRRHAGRRRLEGPPAAGVPRDRVAHRRARPGAHDGQAAQDPGHGLHSLPVRLFAAARSRTTPTSSRSRFCRTTARSCITAMPSTSIP